MGDKGKKEKDKHNKQVIAKNEANKKKQQPHLNILKISNVVTNQRDSMLRKILAVVVVVLLVASVSYAENVIDVLTSAVEATVSA